MPVDRIAVYCASQILSQGILSQGLACRRIGMLKPVLNCLPNEDRAIREVRIAAIIASESAIQLAKDLSEKRLTIRVNRHIKLANTA